MQDLKTDKNGTYQKVGDAVRLTKEGKYEEALAIFEKSLPQLSTKDVTEKRMLSISSSYYGLCVAKIKRRYAEAVNYCNLSLKSNFMDPDHRANLALVYLERYDRKNAIKNLYAGLKIQPGHLRINRILNRIGRRRKPVVPFLSRDNPLNIWLGRMRHARKPNHFTRRAG